MGDPDERILALEKKRTTINKDIVFENKLRFL